MLIALVFVIAVGTALLATPGSARLLTVRRIYGHVRAGSHGDTSTRVPRLGGIPIIFATTAALLVALLVQGESELLFAGVLAAGWLLFGVGLADDLWNLPPSMKLLAQCLAALTAFGFGFRIDEITLAGATMSLGVLALPLTVVWIVAVTNAFNLIDGLDGLATGVALVALGSTFGVSLYLGNMDVALVCAALGGALLGFLPYNFRPARIFLGDSGSLFIGFMVAVLSVHGSTKSATAVLTAVPFLVLALPLFDTCLAIARRWLRGRPVFAADEHHLHHRLMAAGLTHVRAVVFLYVVAAAVASVGLVIAFAPPTVVTTTTVVGAASILALLLFGIHRLGYHEFVEAHVVVRWGVHRTRQRIRDQIHARDVAKVLAHAESLDAVRAILADNAQSLGMLSVIICHEESVATRTSLPDGAAAVAWKLECPLRVHAPGSPLVLRVWTDAPDDRRMLTTDRVMRVLARAVEAWLEQRAVQISVAAPSQNAGYGGPGELASRSA